MTVSASVARAQYNGTGSTGPFAFNFKLFATSHMKVVKTSTAGVDTTLTETTDYVVSLASDFSSATVLLVSALASGEKLTLLRDPPQSQLSSWPRNDPFPAATHERAADLAVMLIQSLSEILRRVPTLAESSAYSGLVFPDPSASKLLGWNSAGTALENKSALALDTVTLPGSITDNALIKADGTTGDTYQATGIIVDDSNNVSGIVNLAATGYLDLAKVATPASPSANVARIYAVDDGSGVTTFVVKDSAGNVVPLSHFLQSGTGVVTRTQQAKARDIVSVNDWGAVGDGVTGDTTAITAADSDSRAKFLPDGFIYDTEITATSLIGPYWGRGQIRDSANNLRGPWFSAISSAPASEGDHSSVNTAFNGDLSGVQIAMEHRVTGASTAGAPSTGYKVFEEVSPIMTFDRRESGHNEATSSNDGRTGQSTVHMNVFHTGQGDFGAIYVSGITTGARAGATSFLANPAIQAMYGQLFAGADGSYLNLFEFVLDDNSFDAAAVGIVLNMIRSDGTAALNEVWMAHRPKSNGAADCDVIYSGAGGWKRGLDFSAVTFDSDKAAIALKDGDFIYGDTSASGDVSWSQTLGSATWGYVSGISAWRSSTGIKSISPTAGVGYATGAGGQVTQATSKSTAVTLNTVSGQITMNNASLASGAEVVFNFNNTAYDASAGDTMIAHHASGGTSGVYTVDVGSGGTNQVKIRVTNKSGGALGEAIVINFNVIKGAIA